MTVCSEKRSNRREVWGTGILRVKEVKAVLRALLSERKWPCAVGPQRQHHGVRFQLGDERTSARNTVNGLKL